MNMAFCYGGKHFVPEGRFDQTNISLNEVLSKLAVDPELGFWVSVFLITTTRANSPIRRMGSMRQLQTRSAMYSAAWRMASCMYPARMIYNSMKAHTGNGGKGGNNHESPYLA